MIEQKCSYPESAVPPDSADRPFFLTTKVPMPEISEKGGRLEAKIYKYWNLAEEELVKMSKDPERAKPLQALLHRSSTGETIRLKDISISFGEEFCYWIM